MTALTAIVADDEDLIRASVVRHLEKLWPELAVIGQAGNGLEALALIEQTASHEFLIKTPIRELADRLDPDQFRQVHRSAIVNMEKIQAIQRSFTNQMVIRFADTDRKIRVSRAYEHLFKAM